MKHHTTGLESSAHTILANISGTDGSPIVVGGISSLVLIVTADDGLPTHTDTIAPVADVLSGSFKFADVGDNNNNFKYNFEHTITADAFPSAGHYDIDYRFTQTDGHEFVVSIEHEAGEVVSHAV